MAVRMIIIAIFCSAGTVVGCGTPKDDEVKKLKGQWKIVKVAGGEIPTDPDDRIVTFSDKDVAFGATPKTTAPFFIDPTQNPKWMDIEAEPLASPGIYKLEDDKLTIVVVNVFPNGKPPPRPTSFEGKLPGVVLYLERIKKP